MKPMDNQINGPEINIEEQIFNEDKPAPENDLEIAEGQDQDNNL